MGVLKNPRHEAFARQYVKIGIARHAYLAAGYKAKCDDPSGANSADVNASRLLRHAKVKPRIERLRTAMAKRQDVTEDSLIEELEQARLIAAAERQTGSMVAATMGKAKLAGLLIERKEIGDAGEFQRMSEQELREYIQGTEAKPTNNGTDTVQ